MNPFKIYFQNGIGVYTGKVVETKPHSHHATEIIYGLEGSFNMADAQNNESEYRLSLIAHDIKHRFINDKNITPIFIYLDPFHSLAQQLKRYYKLDSDIVPIEIIPQTHVIKHLNSWIHGNEVDLPQVITDLVNQLTSRSLHPVQCDDRILKSIESIRQALHSEIRIVDIASGVHLSASRYAHLFKELVGIPFRRFVIWTRLQTTVQSIMSGNSLTSACYEGGFADLSHFSKTFTNMFGVSPSGVLKG